MESHKAMPSNVDMPRRSLLLPVLAVLSVLAAVAGAFYLGLQKSAIEAEQKILSADLISLQGEITALEDQNIEAAQIARQWMDEISGSEVLWSRIITRIQSMLPVDPVTQAPKVIVSSYSGSEDGRLILSGQTASAQIEPYEYVSELLSVFNGGSYFYQAIIPSISKGETDQGEKFLNFAMNFNYRQESVTNVSGEASTQETAEDADAAGKPKVPRQ